MMLMESRADRHSNRKYSRSSGGDSDSATYPPPPAYLREMKWIRRVKRISIVVLCVPAVWLLVGLWGSSPERQQTPLPVILQNIQSLGELHTTRYTYNNVFEYQSSKKPAEWAERIGMGSVVRSATRNRALVSATGTVEAGVDLAQADARYEGVPGKQTLVVTLPQPTIYPPQVDAKVHDTKKGMFWRDENLGLKAQKDASRRFTLASREQGILKSARTSAEARIKALLSGVTEGSVRVQFGATL